MPLDVNSVKYICSKCGQGFSTKRSNFITSYSELYKGYGRLPICNKCVDTLYSKYLAQCDDQKLAMRQICRKLDLYWNDSVFDSVYKQSSERSLISRYMQRINTLMYSGKSYDDTLLEEGTLWRFFKANHPEQNNDPPPTETEYEDTDEDAFDGLDDIEITNEIKEFWGPGYSLKMYRELEQRRRYWMSKFPSDTELDLGTEALIRQICNLEIDINKDRAAGKSIDKSVNALNNLLGSAQMKPAQKKDAGDSSLADTPLGVWLYKYEQKRPLPEVDDKLKSNHIKKYIFTWMGHLCKMLNIKNGYTRLYEEEVERLKVERPEYDGDEEDLLIDSYSDEEGDSS